jgi:hypothetical protein
MCGYWIPVLTPHQYDERRRLKFSEGKQTIIGSNFISFYEFVTKITMFINKSTHNVWDLQTGGKIWNFSKTIITNVFLKSTVDTRYEPTCITVYV